MSTDKCGGIYFFEIGFLCVAQVGLELMSSVDHPASASGSLDYRCVPPCLA
jgi:hypothetical protein